MSPTNSFCAMNEASTHRGDASEMFSKHSENAFSTMNSSFYHNLSYDSNPRNCIICHRWINRKYEIDLDCTTLSDSGYICQSCRDSPVSAAEVPLAATSVDSLNASPTSIPPQDGVHAAFEIMQLNAAGHSDSSLNDVNCLDPYNEIFSTSSQQMDDIPSTALTTYPNHRRKAPEQESSMYYMEAGVNDADDLQALIRRNKCEGISCSSRGGRGGFSKGLATMPRSSSSKGRSFSTSNDLYSTNSFGRGQRAMRSGIKSGRGRRPRGGKASVVISTLVSAANNAVATNTVAPPNTQIEQEKVCTEVILPNKYDKMGINSRAVLVTSIEHTFFLQKPICLICGSVGNDAEGAMVSCSSCAQSYHTFCVWIHDKVSQAVLKRGWRCHNCLVCESCGEMKRETAAFISCFECGMFYHTNCLPAVGYYHNPHASWRCKWCSTCRRCGKQLLKCGDMRRTEGLCELCFSLHKCSKCYRLYETGDEIIKCQQCDRWCHGKCEEICGEEVLDAVCESGFRCSSCRPHGKFQINDASNAIACDNVMLNRCAMEILQARYGGLLMRSNPQYLNESTYGPYGARGRPFDDGFDDEEMEMATPVLSGRGRGMRGGGPGRKVLKLGVGGFCVKIPRHRLLALGEEPNGDDEKTKMKRPRKPRRSQLEDNYPPVIQESFFGIKPIEGKVLIDMVVDEPILSQEIRRVKLHSDKDQIACQLSESSADALKEGENVLGIMDTDIIRNMEAIDFDNFDVGLFTNVPCDEDDDDDCRMNIDDIGPVDGSLESLQESGSGQDGVSLVLPLPSSTIQNAEFNMKAEINVDPQSVLCSTKSNLDRANYSLQSAGVHSQSNSRCSSGVGEICIERVNQATERWEEDEPLGERATKAAVLYANLNHPEWKTVYPEWNERVKHIHRVWRSLDANSRQGYVNKARENRAYRTKITKVKRASSNLYHAAVAGSSSQNYSFQIVNGVDSRNEEENSDVCLQHLSTEVLNNYNMLLQRNNELLKYFTAIENDLARMRKQKKNLTAKKRQLNKNKQLMDAQGRRIEVDLNDSDKASLIKLLNTIPIRQTDLDNCKKDIKEHISCLRDYATKNNIPMSHVNQTTASAMQAIGFNVPSVQSPGIASAIRPPPSYLNVTEQSPNYRSNHVSQSLLSAMKPDVDGPLLESGASTPTPVRYSSMESTDLMKSKLPRKRKVHVDILEYERSAIIGGVLACSITSQLDLDVFDTVDNLLIQVAIMTDGPRSARSGVPKRPSDLQLDGILYSSQMSFDRDELVRDDLIPDGHLNYARVKKKRSQHKKPVVSNNNEYDLLLERICTQLRLCPPLPRRALEPEPRLDRTLCAEHGVTDLPVVPENRISNVNKLGLLRLDFMEDYYTRMLESPIDEKSLFYSMSHFCNGVNLSSLYRTQPTYSNFMWMENSENLMAKMKSLKIDRRSRSPPLRNLSRIPECVPPQSPHRSSFIKKPNLPDKVHISLVIEEVEGSSDCERSFQNLMQFLNVDPCPGFSLDTPPGTPESFQDVTEDCGAASVSDQVLCCRTCNSVMKEPAIRHSFKRSHCKDEEALFCSMSCFYNFVVSAGLTLSNEDLQNAERFVDEDTMANLRQISAENFARYLQQGRQENLTVKSETVYASNSERPSTSDVRWGASDSDSNNNRLRIIHVRDLPLHVDSTVPNDIEKKWKGRLWMKYSDEIAESFRHLSNQVSEVKHVFTQPDSDLLRAIHNEDTRMCILCGEQGDGKMTSTGRLINADANVWVHVNCALWSQEVYECQFGALLNVGEAIRRSAEVHCSVCKKPGASLPCYRMNCDSIFHFPCALSTNGNFMKDRVFICIRHEDVRKDQCIDRFEVMRRVFVSRDDDQVVSKLFHSGDDRLVLRIGTFIFRQLGQLLPEQLKSFHNSEYIFPIGYKISRSYWSSSNKLNRTWYECSIADSRSGPQFIISYDDKVIRNTSCTGAWNIILDMVEHLHRCNDDALRFIRSHLRGELLYGLNEPVISKMIESLPGVDQLATYSFRHGGSPLLDLPLAVNPCGCIRSEIRFRTLIKRKRRNQPSAAHSIHMNEGLDIVPRDMRNRGGLPVIEQCCSKLSSISSSASDSWSPYARWDVAAINSSYYSQYQKMKREWKSSVYLARSRIQGLGLFASRDIEMNSMIIEYKGELIRTEVSEMREKRYEVQNRGVYMFRIDDERLVDATMAGGPARYINHSCDPNCSTRIVNSGPTGGDKKIIIIANRPISAGEELTYDYQFDIEDTDDKIACLCGAPNCQKWMN